MPNNIIINHAGWFIPKQLLNTVWKKKKHSEMFKYTTLRLKEIDSLIK